MTVNVIAQSMKRGVAAGGQVLGEPMDIHGVGRYVSFMDTRAIEPAFSKRYPELEDARKVMQTAIVARTTTLGGSQ